MKYRYRFLIDYMDGGTVIMEEDTYEKNGQTYRDAWVKISRESTLNGEVKQQRLLDVVEVEDD